MTEYTHNFELQFDGFEMAGKRFGGLVVLGRAPKRNNITLKEAINYYNNKYA